MTGRTTATKGRILEVSDEEAIREIIVAMCESRGFEVIQARCGDEALSLYRTCSPFALVLSDLYWYNGGAIEPPLNYTETIRHGIQLALAIRKLAPAQCSAAVVPSPLPTLWQIGSGSPASSPYTSG